MRRNAQSETLESWRQSVAALAKGNSRFVFAISAALAGPLIELSGQLSDGFNIRGASSSGKPAALRLATSVWGRLRNTSTPGALDGGRGGGRTGLRVLLPTRGMRRRTARPGCTKWAAPHVARSRKEIRALEQAHAFIEVRGPNRFIPTGLNPGKRVTRGDVAGCWHATLDGFSSDGSAQERVQERRLQGF